MQRRTVLRVVSGVSVVGVVAGCTGDSDDGNGDDGNGDDGNGDDADAGDEIDPAATDAEATLETFYAAYAEGDIETLNGMIHPDAVTGRIEGAEAAEIEALAPDLEISISEVDLVEERTGEVVVEFTLESTHPEWDEESSRERTTLRSDEGEWKIFDQESAE